MSTVPNPETKLDPARWAPTASLAMLRRRAELLGRLRAFLDARGYFEVETPLLSADACIDEHLEPFGVPTDHGERFLQTSPEFGMKRLLAAGAEAIWQITRSFRRDEAGRLHNAEFTIVEWYRVGWDHLALMAEVSALGETVCGWPAAEQLSYCDAFRRHAHLDVATATNAALAERAADAGFDPAGAGRDELLNMLLATLVEPHLGAERPCLLFDYPAAQSALAKIRSDDGFPVAERFELYFRGIELANGYHELTDPAELRRRNATRLAARQQRGHRPLPLASQLLDAMDAGLPPCAGVALGFDRLAMLALGADSLAEVVAFPFDRA